MDAFDISQLISERKRSERLYLEFLRKPSLSMGVYELAAGALDPQKPHTEDEVYYVVSGRAMAQIGEKARPVQDGSIIYVPANLEHRFHTITEDLTLLVFFAPAE